MLQTFRKHSGGIFAKLLFGLLVASFAFFGIGDMISGYSSMQPVAKVGKISVSQEEFLRDYQRNLSRLQTIAKGKLKPEDIQNLGIEQRVMDDLVNNAVLDNEISRLGLVVSNSALEDFIKSVPVFHNKYGQFDRNQFRYLLLNNEMSEMGFIQQSRESLLKQQLIGTLSSGLRLPVQYADLIFKAQEEQKVFDVVYIPLDSMKISETPSESDLDQLYQTHQELFVHPEYRSVSVLIVDPDKIQSAIKITPEQIQEEYKSRQKEFTTPELRDVTQLTFSSRQTAEKAHSELLEGKSAADISRDLKVELRNYSGANQDKFSEDHAKAIFAASDHGITDVLSSALGWTIFKITNITQPQLQSLDTVRSKIEDDLRLQTYNSKINDLQNRIEDSLAGGTPVTELAQTYSLSELSFDSIDASGMDRDGKSVLPKQLKELIIENAFNQEEGIASSLMNTPDGRSVAVLVTKITPKTLPPLQDIKADVTKTWLENKQREAASKVASDMAASVKSLGALKSQAKTHDLAVRTLQPINRVELEEGKLSDSAVTTQALRSAFALSSTQAAAAPVKSGFVVIMLVKNVPLVLSDKMKEKRDSFDKALNMMVQRDFQDSYITALKEQNKPSIRQDVIKKLLAR